MPRVVVLSSRAQLIVLFGRASPRGVFVLLTLVGNKNLHAYIEGLIYYSVERHSPRTGANSYNLRKRRERDGHVVSRKQIHC